MTVIMEHANLTVASIDEAEKFLGIAFDDFRRRGGGRSDAWEWVHFGNDDTYVAFQQSHQHQPRRDVSYRNDGINHIGFVVDNLDEIIGNLADAGYSITDASAMEGHPFRRRAYVIDGNGIEWEFVEYASTNPDERNDYSL